MWEIAREFHLEARTVLQVLRDMGSYVRSASSTLESAEVQNLRERLAARPTRGPLLPPAQVGDADVDPQEEAIRRNLGLDCQANLRAASNATHRSARSSRPSRSANPYATTRSAPPRRQPDPWAENFFEVDERDAWWGSGVYDPSEALALIQMGITSETRPEWGTLPTRAIQKARELGLGPADMKKKIGNSPPIGSMLETGSTVAEIRELYRHYRAHQRPAI